MTPDHLVLRLFALWRTVNLSVTPNPSGPQVNGEVKKSAAGMWWVSCKVTSFFLCCKIGRIMRGRSSCYVPVPVLQQPYVPQTWSQLINHEGAIFGNIFHLQRLRVVLSRKQSGNSSSLTCKNKPISVVSGMVQTISDGQWSTLTHNNIHNQNENQPSVPLKNFQQLLIFSSSFQRTIFEPLPRISGLNGQGNE